MTVNGRVPVVAAIESRRPVARPYEVRRCIDHHGKKARKFAMNSGQCHFDAALQQLIIRHHVTDLFTISMKFRSFSRSIEDTALSQTPRPWHPFRFEPWASALRLSVKLKFLSVTSGAYQYQAARRGSPSCTPAVWYSMPDRAMRTDGLHCFRRKMLCPCRLCCIRTGLE